MKISCKYICLFILIAFSYNISYSQDWSKLTTQNIYTYFEKNGYSFDKKKVINSIPGIEDGTICYYGKKTFEEGFGTEEIYFFNGMPYGIVTNLFTNFTPLTGRSASGLGKDFFAKSLVSTYKSNIDKNYNLDRYKILHDKDNHFETDWRINSDNMFKSKFIIKILSDKRYFNGYTVVYKVLVRKNIDSMTIAGVNVKNIDSYNLKEYVELFCRDLYLNIYPNNNRFITSYTKEIVGDNLVDVTFKELNGNIIALAYAKDYPEVVLKVDPKNWANSSFTKKMYIIYHELGHDILNFSHGEGGKMMYNFVDREYEWEEFINDKNKMFEIWKDQNQLSNSSLKNQQKLKLSKKDYFNKIISSFNNLNSDKNPDKISMDYDNETLSITSYNLDMKITTTIPFNEISDFHLNKSELDRFETKELGDKIYYYSINFWTETKSVKKHIYSEKFSMNEIKYDDFITLSFSTYNSQSDLKNDVKNTYFIIKNLFTEYYDVYELEPEY